MILTCPRCHHAGDLDIYDALGACPWRSGTTATTSCGCFCAGSDSSLFRGSHGVSNVRRDDGESVPRAATRDRANGLVPLR